MYDRVRGGKGSRGAGVWFCTAWSFMIHVDDDVSMACSEDESLAESGIQIRDSKRECHMRHGLLYNLE